MMELWTPKMYDRLHNNVTSVRSNTPTILAHLIHWTVLANCIVLIFHLVLLKTHNHSHSLGRESIKRKGVYYTRNLAPYHTDRLTRCPARLCGPGEGGAGCQLAVDRLLGGGAAGRRARSPSTR